MPEKMLPSYSPRMRESQIISQKSSQNSAPFQTLYIFLSSYISFSRNTWCIEYKAKQFCKADSTGRYLNKPNKGS